MRCIILLGVVLAIAVQLSEQKPDPHHRRGVAEDLDRHRHRGVAEDLDRRHRRG